MAGTKLSIGIVGLPNVGKSTLFKKLTSQDIIIANYPFATIEPNVGVVTVPDKRLDVLAEMNASKKVIPAILEFYDIAGLVRGAHKGEGLGNEFLGHIGETNAIIIVLRCFKDGGVIHIDGSIDPIRDLESIETELVLKDMEIVERWLDISTRGARSGDAEDISNKEILELMIARLGDGSRLWGWQDMTEKGEVLAKKMNLLTAKPQIVLLNGRDEDVSESLVSSISSIGSKYIVVDMSSDESVVNDLIIEAYSTLNLISFFTSGESETRAWTIKDGIKAPQASGVIHTDFEDKFIRLEVVSYDDFVNSGGWNSAKQKGLVKIEGKEYVIRDGDVVLVRHG
jgi:ribosome-binding ATPase